MTILDKIIRNKHLEVELAKRRMSRAELQSKLYTNAKQRSLCKKMALSDKFHFICEIKKASPSRGLIQADFDPVKQARSYQTGGASAISVLTERKYFKGSLGHLVRVKKNTDLPVLRKDFIIDEYQIYESAAAGADLILFIARILDKEMLTNFCHLAYKLNLEVLIEVAEQTDIEKLPAYSDQMILGINNRNLHSFQTSIDKSLVLKSLIPPGFPLISESGIKSAEDCRLLLQNGFNGVLIGEALMRSTSPEKLLKILQAGTAGNEN